MKKIIYKLGFDWRWSTPAVIILGLNYLNWIGGPEEFKQALFLVTAVMALRLENFMIGEK